MTKRSQTHATFVLERTYPVPVERVWEAFADPEIKRQWFGSADFTEQDRREDFRVGGVAIHDGRRPKSGPLSQFRATYTDIVPHERIVYTFRTGLPIQTLLVAGSSELVQNYGTDQDDFVVQSLWPGRQPANAAYGCIS